MRITFLIRLDDACPTMDRTKWQLMEDILDKYGIKPMVGVIPNNEDTMQQVDPVDETFWEKAKTWEKKDWAIALHGYSHCYISQEGLKGLNPFWKFSEFAGVPLNVQKEKIRKGMAILKSHGIEAKYFFAPGHTFDENTLTALREESNIRIISDTIATKPYRRGDFVFIPQFGGHCREMKRSGVYTFCFHPNTMNVAAFDQLDYFLNTHQNEFLSFGGLDLSNVKSKSLFDRLLCFGYFTYRKMKRLQ